MLIRKHWKLPFVLRALGDTTYCQWVRPIRSLPVEALIAAPAALADYIASQPALLEKPMLRLVVLGTALDAADDGAWWSTLGTLLDKPSNWCHVHIYYHDKGEINLQIRSPAAIKTHVHVTQGDLREILLLPSTVDIAFLPVATSDVLDLLLGSDNHLWPLLNGGTAVLAGFTHSHEVALHTALAEVFGLQVAEQANHFYTEDLPIQTLVTVRGAQPTNLATRINDAEQLASAAETIAELCADSILGSSSAPDAFRSWGQEGLLKSSADSSDTYITLPRRYAVRRRTGVVYRVENDLAIGDGYPGKLPPAAFAELPLDANWATRIAWAAAAWRSGVGEMIGNTLGGAAEAAGFDGLSREGTRELLNRFGIEEDHIEALADVLDGGAHYAPSQRERQALDRLKAGDVPGLLKLLEDDPGLLTTMDETRLPLLTAVGRRGMHDVMRRMLDLGAPANIMDGSGRTALAELATTGRSTESVAMLLDAGANPNVADARGWTALLLALKTSRWENARLLLDRGADPTLPNIMGLSAVTLASGDYSRELEQAAADTLHQLIGFDVDKALKQNRVIADAQDIPSDLRTRLLSHR